MAKYLVVLVGASILALAFPSVFDEYRRTLSADGEAEALEPSAAIVNVALAPPSGRTSLMADADGHFRSQAQLNGRSVDVLVDTGATFVAMSEGTARRLGLRLAPDDFRYRSRTANGETATALAKLDTVRIGGVEVRDVDAAVMKGESLNTVLLGMSFLKKLSRYQVTSGRLDLSR